MKLDFFDCNAQIGRFGTPVEESFFTARELVERLEPMGIRRALVFHALSKELHPAEGNPALLDEIASTLGRDLKSRPNVEAPLVPCWVAIPHHTGEVPPPAEFVDQMEAAGVRAVRLFPAAHNYSLAEWCAGEMLGEFEARRVPVFVELGQTNYDHIASALQHYPKLRLIVMQTSYRCDRYMYPLMERHDHLRIEISSYVVTGGIEAVCRRFGARILVFGTGSPFLEPAAPVSLVTLADISHEEKQAIAAGNMEELLAWE